MRKEISLFITPPKKEKIIFDYSYNVKSKKEDYCLQ
jgi:hypothetical protein